MPPRLALAALAVAALLAAPAGPAAAQVLTPTQDPLPGSSFQGGDGDQAATGGLDDWASLQADGRVVHTPDDNAQDTGFRSGQEHTPDDWVLDTFANGVTPPADNIRDAWSSVDAVGGNTFLYLAFARYAAGGTTFLTFELNRDHRLWRNAAGSLVPCRLDGDLLITFEPHGSDPNVTVTVRRWRTAEGPGGTDPASGCARRGSLGEGTGVTVDDLQGAANTAGITNSLPGSVAPGATIAPRLFGEVAVNVAVLFEQALGTTCGAFTSVWMHSRASDSPQAELKDYVEPQRIDLRRCSAAGTKWHDLNADGVRQGGEEGLEGWRIYADLDDDQQYDRGEPFAITDERGDYVIDDITATGTYTLREEPTADVPNGPWTCSHPDPCSWTVDAAAEPFARDRDFGNWRPASVTLVKNIDPANDPGRFDLSVGPFVLAGAGHGDRETFQVTPGSHTVTETAAAGTNAADYVSSVACTGPYQPSRRRVRSVSTRITVMSGEPVKCTFVNARIGVPSITIDKVPPRPTVAGNPLVYELRVTNTGTVAFGADTVEVSDSQCDDPTLVEQRDGSGAADGTPGSLDPGDQWTYRCEVPTSPPSIPEDCVAETVTNDAIVSAPGAQDGDSATAPLLCPPPPRGPVIEIVKVGAVTAVAGTPLTYRLYVTNISTAPARFTEAQLHVSDVDCDAPPVVVDRFADEGASTDQTPEVLDPLDVWVFECTRSTAPAGADCLPFSLPNTATVDVTTTDGRLVDDDSDAHETLMTCPPGPPQPPGPVEPPVPGPSGEAPEVPDMPDVPEAGTAGRAALSSLPRCLRRGSRVTIRGRRMAAVRVTVRGRRVGGLRIRALQRRAIIRVRRNFAPGRYRVTARVRFQRGAATPTLRLTRTVRICAPRRSQVQPRFTG